MGLIDFVIKNSLLIGVVTVIIFLGWQFVLKPKLFSKKKETLPTNNPDPATPIPAQQISKSNSEQKDTTLKRMGRGFQFMGSKIKNIHDKVADSEYVKNMQQEQATGKFDDFMPREFMEQEEYEPPRKQKKNPLKKKRDDKNFEQEENPFATDFTNIGKFNFRL